VRTRIQFLFLLMLSLTTGVFACNEQAALVAQKRLVSVKLSYVQMPAGTFQMGSPTTEAGRGDDEILHPVILTKPFEIQNTPITQKQWYEVMGVNPSQYKLQVWCPDSYSDEGGGMCPDHPVENVSLVDICGTTSKCGETDSFVKIMNDQNDGYTYRIPTEAEWEYSARAGTTSAYFFGDDPSVLGDYAWWAANSGITQDVGTKLPNPAGLYDMYGNVWEWVSDVYDDYIRTGTQTDPQGPIDDEHVVRGGAWSTPNPAFMRSAWRSRGMKTGHDPDVGFRLVRTQN